MACSIVTDKTQKDMFIVQEFLDVFPDEIPRLLPKREIKFEIDYFSQLRKYVCGLSHILKSNLVQVKENLSFEVKPIRILDSQVKQLHGRSIPMVKVFWVLIFGYST